MAGGAGGRGSCRSPPLAGRSSLAGRPAATLGAGRRPAPRAERKGLPFRSSSYLRRWWRVRRNIFLCFFLRMRLRRFLISEPMRPVTLAGVTCAGHAVRGRSIGRTPDFGSVNRGSIPLPGAPRPAGLGGRSSRQLVSSRIWTHSNMGSMLRRVSSDTIDNEALLRRHGLQVTAQRLAVLRAVSEHPHSTADDIGDVVRAEIGAISRQAVYDALDGPHRQGSPPAHPAGRVAGPLRDPCRGQPPSCDLPSVRPDGRRRLRGRRYPMLDGGR